VDPAVPQRWPNRHGCLAWNAAGCLAGGPALARQSRAHICGIVQWPGQKAPAKRQNLPPVALVDVKHVDQLRALLRVAEPNPKPLRSGPDPDRGAPGSIRRVGPAQVGHGCKGPRSRGRPRPLGREVCGSGGACGAGKIGGGHAPLRAARLHIILLGTPVGLEVIRIVLLQVVHQQVRGQPMCGRGLLGALVAPTGGSAVSPGAGLPRRRGCPGHVPGRPYGPPEGRPPCLQGLGRAAARGWGPCRPQGAPRPGASWVPDLQPG
jgi:hypothetical protein